MATDKRNKISPASIFFSKSNRVLRSFDRFSKFVKATQLFCLLAGCIFTACSTPVLFDENIDISQAGWPENEVATLKVPVAETLSHCTIFVNLRHNDNYLYDNIFLEVIAVSPTGARVADTLEYRLADERGKWFGKPGGQWYDCRLPFRSDVQFLVSGNYLFHIRQLMRQEALPGVGSVGIRIERGTMNDE